MLSLLIHGILGSSRLDQRAVSSVDGVVASSPAPLGVALIYCAMLRPFISPQRFTGVLSKGV